PPPSDPAIRMESRRRDHIRSLKPGGNSLIATESTPNSRASCSLNEARSHCSLHEAPARLLRRAPSIECVPTGSNGIPPTTSTCPVRPFALKAFQCFKTCRHLSEASFWHAQNYGFLEHDIRHHFLLVF